MALTSLGLPDVRRLAHLLRELPEIGSLEVRGRWGSVSLTRTRTPGPAAEPHGALQEIRAPMAGTFARASAPNTKPAVEVGARITVGQTVGGIEAQGILHEIEAAIAGVVRDVCVADAEWVAVGRVLFRVETA